MTTSTFTHPSLPPEYARSSVAVREPDGTELPSGFFLENIAFEAARGNLVWPVPAKFLFEYLASGPASGALPEVFIMAEQRPPTPADFRGRLSDYVVLPEFECVLLEETGIRHKELLETTSQMTDTGCFEILTAESQPDEEFDPNIELELVVRMQPLSRRQVTVRGKYLGQARPRFVYEPLEDD